ncbi:MAG: YopX family protein [Candidatus Pacearchaeota archaeon]
MKNLKFRAWDKQEKKMITNFVLAPTSPEWNGFPIVQSTELYEYVQIVQEKIGVINEDWKDILLGFTLGDYTLIDWANWYGIDNYIVMQYTGHKDQNNIELYEGDIIEYYDYMNDNIKLTYIKWYEDTCRFDTDFGYNLDIILTDKFKIIGNIYENPELIKDLS